MLTPICDNSDCKTNLEVTEARSYVRKAIEPAFPQTTTYYVRSLRDDKVTIWVNGTLVFADTSGGGSQWTRRIPVHLVVCPNLIAAKMEDSGGGGNYFDLELAGGLLSQPPVTDNVILRTYYSGLDIVRLLSLVARNEIASSDGDAVYVRGDAWPIIRNNRFHHNAGYGVSFSNDWPGGGPSIYNNTIYSNGLFGIYWSREWRDQPDIQNNIVSRNRQGGIVCRRTRTGTVAYNDAWSNPIDYDQSQGDCPARPETCGLTRRSSMRVRRTIIFSQVRLPSTWATLRPPSTTMTVPATTWSRTAVPSAHSTPGCRSC